MRLDNPSISGSISYLGGGTNTISGIDAKITGSFTGSFTGEVLGTSSIATTASYIKLSNVDGSASLASRITINSASIASLETVSGSYANSASFASNISANSASIASLETVSGSYANSASFASNISANSASIASLETVSGSYANSASFASNISTNSSSIGSLNAVSSSYLLNTTDTLTGDLTVTGNIIATTLNVQDVTASVVYSSGSNIFGSSSIDTQQFTGSILTSGSIEVNGDKFTVSGATGNTVVGGTLNSGAITSTGAGTFAGNISVASGTISILGGNNMTLAGPASHGGISFGTNSILPATAAATNNNVFDLGATAERFKNLYLGSEIISGGGATFAGSITGLTSSFVSTVAGTTVVSAEGAYAGSGSVKLFEAKRSGGAVAADWSYDDATTDMSLGTSTAHSFSLKTGNTRALTISNSQNTTFAGSITIPQYIYHTGDTDTYIQFQTDRQTYLAGGDEFIDFREATESYITIGNSNDTDTRMQGGAGYIFIQGSNGYIGINDATPSYPFQVSANTVIEGTLQTTENVGIGVEPAAHYGGYEVLDIGNSLSLISNNTSTNVSILTNNAYLNSGATAWVRKAADEATMYEQVSGEHRFSNAGSAAAGAAISWSERMRIDSSGNVGIGVTPFAHTLGTSVSLDLKGNGGIWGYAGATYVNSNAYYDSGWKYKSTAPAAVLQVGGSSQELTFRQAVSGTAGNPITYTQPFTIDTSGNVGIGTLSPDQVGYGYKVLTIMGGTTAGYAGVLELLTPTTDTNGQNLGIISFGSGGTRNAMIGAVRQSGNNNGKLEFWTSAGAPGIQRRMTIDADGQVGIGTDQPRTKFEIFRPAGQSSTPQLTLGTGENSSVDYSLATDTVSAGDFCILSGVSNTSSAIKMRFQGNDVFFGTPTSTYPSTNNFVHINTQSGVSMIIGGHSGTHTAVQFRHNGSTVCGAIVITSTSTSYNSGSSDKRLKKNITNWNENILDKFKDLQPKEFHFNNQDNTEKKQKGYIAQNEVDKFPEAYPLVEDEESGEKRYQFNPSGMNIYLMKAIQELEARIKILENK